MRPSQRPVKVYLGLWGGRLNMSLNRSTALTALWSGAALKVPDWPTTCSMFWCTWAASTRPGMLPISPLASGGGALDHLRTY